MKILESDRDLTYYTHMDKVLKPFKDYYLDYNWLITDYECNDYPEKIIEFKDEYIWITGKRLYEIIETYEIQFIWAVFSGFQQNVKFNEIMEYELPKSKDYDHWENKNNTQIPLADVEIVSWDSSCLLFKCKNDDHLNIFKNNFPLSKAI